MGKRVSIGAGRSPSSVVSRAGNQTTPQTAQCRLGRGIAATDRVGRPAACAARSRAGWPKFDVVAGSFVPIFHLARPSPISATLSAVTSRPSPWRWIWNSIQVPWTASPPAAVHPAIAVLLDLAFVVAGADPGVGEVVVDQFDKRLCELGLQMKRKSASRWRTSWRGAGSSTGRPEENGPEGAQFVDVGGQPALGGLRRQSGAARARLWPSATTVAAT